MTFKQKGLHRVSTTIQQLKDFAHKTNSQQVQNCIQNLTLQKTQRNPTTLWRDSPKSLEHAGNYMDGIL
jgi:hypothetical protein